MRAILIAAVILLLLAIGGYLTVIRNNDRTSINFETQKLEQDTKRFVDKTKHEWEETRQKGKSMLEERREPPPANPANP
jgi:hypothetical protein